MKSAVVVGLLALTLPSIVLSQLFLLVVGSGMYWSIDVDTTRERLGVISRNIGQLGRVFVAALPVEIAGGFLGWFSIHNLSQFPLFLVLVLFAPVTVVVMALKVDRLGERHPLAYSLTVVFLFGFLSVRAYMSLGRLGYL
jgi:hypothetical protein